ncbi:CoA-binding protein [Hyphobacterium sp. CCMP332]|nr:CoA-binding protein [Hyphobacterium sp. CCMP332]
MAGKTLVLGASPNPRRYAYLAAEELLAKGHEIVLVGRRKGNIEGVEIETDFPVYNDIDTITLYVGTSNQSQLYDYIFKIKPKRIIFNPGTENSELRKLATEKGIETEYACTLVLLSLDSY